MKAIRTGLLSTIPILLMGFAILGHFQKPELRHMVLFKFKDSVTPEEIRKVEDAFRALPAKIPQIKNFEWGTDVSVENLSQGYTHGFLVTFASEQDRAAYLPHPDHVAFTKIAGPVIDKVLVFDYWSKK